MKKTLRLLHEKISIGKARVLDKFSQVKLAADILNLNAKKDSNSSLSDNNIYNTVCYMASKHEKVFKNFRRNKIYRGIVEAVSKKQGNEYLKLINDTKLFKRDDFKEFQKNDLYGNPLKFSFEIDEENFDFAPTTLRYAKNLCDIISFFDVTEINSIAEIGVGYGGLCRLISSKLQLGGGTR